MKGLRTGLAGVGAAVLASAAFAGTAAAGVPVTTAIRAQDRALKSSSVLAQIKNSGGQGAAAAKKLIPEFRALATKFDHAASVVSSASAMGSQKTAQGDWVRGVRLEATGVDQFATAFQDLVRGDKPGARAALVKGEKTLRSAELIRVKGDKLLGLPSGD